MTQKVPRHLPAGDWVIACCHINTKGKNTNTSVLPFDPQKDTHRLMLAVPETAEATWIMLCQECTRVASAEHGAPYRKFQLIREVSLPG